MTSTTKLFNLAQLSEAAYADFEFFNATYSDTQIHDKLVDKNFSDTQASEFADNWRVISHQPNTASGYSGTLFKYIGNDPNSGFTNGQLA